MKFLHTSDLHIGKMVCGFSMLEEQKAVLRQILELVRSEHIDVVLLAGDLYDRSLPPAPAVSLLDEFLTGLIEAGAVVCAIAGNHDSGERIGFANRILEHRGLYMEGTISEQVFFVDQRDRSTGEAVRIHLLPFARPVQMQEVWKQGDGSYDACIKEAMKHVSYLQDGKNILITHHFVVNHGILPELSDSETRTSVGGADQVEVSHFSKFDYVALGHIHGQQRIGDNPVYYSGSPVKYSFSEVRHRKGVIIGEWMEDGELKLQQVPLRPVHDMRTIKGRLSALVSEDVIGAADPEDYLLAILTNPEELIDPIGTLRSVYPNIMQLQFERDHMGVLAAPGERLFDPERRKNCPPDEVFAHFYENVTGEMMTEEQKQLIREILEEEQGGC